eukprot:4949991-Pleurochrysis_carterae.AAC.1
MAIGAAKWLCDPPAKRPIGTRAAAAITGVRMAKLFGSAANEIVKTYTWIIQNIVNIPQSFEY